MPSFKHRQGLKAWWLPMSPLAGELQGKSPCPPGPRFPCAMALRQRTELLQRTPGWPSSQGKGSPHPGAAPCLKDVSEEVDTWHRACRTGSG